MVIAVVVFPALEEVSIELISPASHFLCEQGTGDLTPFDPGRDIEDNKKKNLTLLSGHHVPNTVVSALLV